MSDVEKSVPEDASGSRRPSKGRIICVRILTGDRGAIAAAERLFLPAQPQRLLVKLLGDQIVVVIGRVGEKLPGYAGKIMIIDRPQQPG